MNERELVESFCMECQEAPGFCENIEKISGKKPYDLEISDFFVYDDELYEVPLEYWPLLMCIFMRKIESISEFNDSGAFFMDMLCSYLLLGEKIQLSYLRKIFGKMSDTQKNTFCEWLLLIADTKPELFNDDELSARSLEAVSNRVRQL